MYECTDFIDSKLNEILTNTNSYHYKFFVGGKNNFRYHIRKEYKANRKEQDTPELFYDVKDYFISNLNAFVSNGVETDDSIVATAKYVKDNELFNPIICSIDKDFKTKPYTIYSWDRTVYERVIENTTTHVTEDEAFYNFAMQMLIGDNGDNIRTCKGVGKAKAKKILADKSRYGMIRAIVETYKTFYKDKWLVRLTEVYHLLNLIDDYERVLVPKEYEDCL